MSPNPRERKILFEKYILGLMSKEESARLEQAIAEDPALAKELEEVTGQLSHYLDKQGIVKSPFKKMGRSIEDFEDLDHEMIMQMTRRNYVLVVWRYALGALSLLLLLLAGYLFSANQNLRIQRTTLAAEAAQREAGLRRRLFDVSELAVDLDSLNTLSFPLDSGVLRVHYIPGEEVIFVNLAQARRLRPTEQYIALAGERPELLNQVIIDAEHLGELHPLHVHDSTLNVWRIDRRLTDFSDTAALGRPLMSVPLPTVVVFD